MQKEGDVVKKIKRGEGEMLAFVMSMVLLLTLLMIFVGFATLQSGILAISDVTTKVGRKLVVTKDMKEAKKVAINETKAMLASNRNIDAKSIKTKVEYAAGSKSWEKGQFFEFTVSAKVNTGSPFATRVYSKKIVLMIERNIHQDDSMMADDITSAQTGSLQGGPGMDRWKAALEKIAYGLEQDNFRYLEHGHKSSYEKALKGNRSCNCALGVSYALQEYGALKKGQTIWLSNTAYHGAKSSKLQIIRHASVSKLQPGDICGFKYPHTAVFLGKENGKYYWVSYGKEGTTNSKRAGGKYRKKKIYHVRHDYYLKGHSLGLIVRIKDLSQGGGD